MGTERSSHRDATETGAKWNDNKRKTQNNRGKDRAENLQGLLIREKEGGARTTLPEVEEGGRERR